MPRKAASSLDQVAQENACSSTQTCLQQVLQASDPCTAQSVYVLLWGFGTAGHCPMFRFVDYKLEKNTPISFDSVLDQPISEDEGCFLRFVVPSQRYGSQFSGCFAAGVIF